MIDEFGDLQNEVGTQEDKLQPLFPTYVRNREI